MTKEIPLTRDYVALVSDVDFDRVNQYKWYYLQSVHTGYAARDVWQEGQRTCIYMHRFVMGMPDASLDVDHVDRNGLHNQRENLRVCTRSVNLHNSRDYKNNKSGYRGVHADKRKKRWVACIRVHGKTIHLGTFDSALMASQAYEQAAAEIYGDANGRH